MYVDCFVWGFWSYWNVSSREKLKLQTEHILWAKIPTELNLEMTNICSEY